MSLVSAWLTGIVVKHVAGVIELDLDVAVDVERVHHHRQRILGVDRVTLASSCQCHPDFWLSSLRPGRRQGCHIASIRLVVASAIRTS